MSQYPDVDRLKSHHSLLREVWAFHSHHTDTWGLEILRGLVLLNSAGVAGVIALAEKNQPGIWPWPAAAFGLGLVMAVLAMLAGRQMHGAASDGWHSALNRFAENPDAGVDIAEEDEKKRDLWHCWTFIFGITSGLAALLGGGLLFLTYHPMA